MKRYITGSMKLMFVVVLLSGCGHRKVDQDAAPESTAENGEQKMERLTSELSKAQSRIEELDAKVAALTDKLDSTKVAVDNIAGSKPVKVEAVGSIKEASIDGSKEVEMHAVTKASVNDPKSLKKMDAAITEFNRAMQLFKAGKFADAELAFNHITETYPDHVLAGSAQFYAGESYYMMGEYKLALNEYNKVVSSFSSSPRVASALVRIAHCYEVSGNAAESSRTLALARDLFEGNPSLDWSGPGRKIDSLATDKSLSTTPMEPHSHPDNEMELKKIADAKIDDLDDNSDKVHTVKH